jgi:uncharacterized protein YndB with AHSA1/START domain
MKLATFVLAALAASAAAHAEERAIVDDRVLDASLERVWEAWTTEAGVKSFFAPGCHIELRVDGLYEIYFDPSKPAGERGADGMRILVLEPKRRLAFTWNAPPSLPAVRGQRTRVELRFETLDDGRTRLRFRHDDWGTGPEWDAAFAYFEKAWPEIVLPRLERALSGEAADWSGRAAGRSD